jgi:hypothetical protein
MAREHRDPGRHAGILAPPAAADKIAAWATRTR